MRISDWSSDVCSSDLEHAIEHRALAFVLPFAFERPVTHLHRMAAPLHVHHRRAAEVCGEARGVDGGRGDDHLQVAAPLQQLLQVAEQEIDVETALRSEEHTSELQSLMRIPYAVFC